MNRTGIGDAFQLKTKYRRGELPRGGGWNSTNVMRSALRYGVKPGDWCNLLGFRTVLSGKSNLSEQIFQIVPENFYNHDLGHFSLSPVFLGGKSSNKPGFYYYPECKGFVFLFDKNRFFYIGIVKQVTDHIALLIM